MIIYSTPACAHCKVFKKELDDAGIKYETKNTDDPDVYEKVLDIASRVGTELPIVVLEDGTQLSRPTIKECL